MTRRGWLTLGIGLVVIVGLVVAFHDRITADFWPLDRSSVGPNLVASFVLGVLAACVAKPLGVALRRWLGTLLEHHVGPLHERLSAAQADREQLHREVRHIIHHHPDIPPMTPKGPAMPNPNRQAGKRGKAPAIPAEQRPRVHLRADAALPVAPASFDHAQGVDLPMALNNELGDCVLARYAHMLAIAYALVGDSWSYVGDDAIRAVYDRLSPNDTGLVIADVLQLGTSGTGVFGGGPELIAYGSVPINDPRIPALIYAMGSLTAGGNVPADCEQQFNEGEWHLAEGRNPGTGGHCFGLDGVGQGPGGYDAWHGDTWGADIWMTKHWLAVYGDELWVPVPTIYRQAGHGPLAAFDVDAMVAEVQSFGARP